MEVGGVEPPSPALDRVDNLAPPKGEGLTRRWEYDLRLEERTKNS